MTPRVKRKRPVVNGTMESKSSFARISDLEPRYTDENPEKASLLPPISLMVRVFP